MMRVFTLVACFVAAIGAGPALAQSEAPVQPLFRGLFGGAAPVASRDQVLDLNGSAFTGRARTDSPDEEDIPDTMFLGGSGSLTYRRSWRGGGSLSGFASGGSSYFRELEDTDQSPWVSRWSAGGGGGYSFELGRRTSLATSASGVYSPYYGLGVGGFATIPGAGGGFGIGGGNINQVPGLDYALTRQPNLSSNGLVMLRHDLSQRSSLDASYSVNALTVFDDDPDEPFGDYHAHRLGGRYRYRINRWVSARAGYDYSRAFYSLEGVEPDGYHTIDLGVDGGYGREFQIARRTTFNFNTTSNIFLVDEVSADGSFDPRLQFFAGGMAGLAHRWGRSWEARAHYNRSASFVDGFREPVQSNTALASVVGVPVRRLDFAANVTYAFGAVGFSGDDNDFDTTTASAQLRWALTRNVAVFGQYFYYTYRFDSGVVLPGSLSRDFERRGWSVGVTAWLPLL
jgi:hypothetical protein